MVEIVNEEVVGKIDENFGTQRNVNICVKSILMILGETQEFIQNYIMVEGSRNFVYDTEFQVLCRNQKCNNFRFSTKFLDFFLILVSVLAVFNSGYIYGWNPEFKNQEKSKFSF